MRTESSTDSGTPAKRGRKAKKVVGRQDSQGNEEQPQNDVIEERTEQGLALKKTAEEASATYSAFKKETADLSGYNTATIEKRWSALAAGPAIYARQKKRAQQLALIFEIDGPGDEGEEDQDGEDVKH